MKNEQYKDKEWLQQKYVVEKLSMEKVARLCHPATTAATILRWLEKHGIESRSLSEAGLGSKHPAWKTGMDTFRNKDWMVQKYVIESLSGRDIAAICGISRHAIIYNLRKHNIKIRPQCPQRGENNKHWKGGRKAADDRRRQTEDYKKYHKEWLEMHPNYMAKKCRKMKRKAIEYKGGKCVACSIEFDGNNACIFDFHHKNPNKKDVTIGMLISRKWETIKKELDKTDMLCSNCHRLRHHSNGGNNVCTSR